MLLSHVVAAYSWCPTAEPTPLSMARTRRSTRALCFCAPTSYACLPLDGRMELRDSSASIHCSVEDLNVAALRAPLPIVLRRFRCFVSRSEQDGTAEPVDLL